MKITHTRHHVFPSKDAGSVATRHGRVAPCRDILLACLKMFPLADWWEFRGCKKYRCLQVVSVCHVVTNTLPPSPHAHAYPPLCRSLFRAGTWPRARSARRALAFALCVAQASRRDIPFFSDHVGVFLALDMRPVFQGLDQVCSYARAQHPFLDFAGSSRHLRFVYTLECRLPTLCFCIFCRYGYVRL